MVEYVEQHDAGQHHCTAVPYCTVRTAGPASLVTLIRSPCCITTAEREAVNLLYCPVQETAAQPPDGGGPSSKAQKGPTVLFGRYRQQRSMHKRAMYQVFPIVKQGKPLCTHLVRGVTTRPFNSALTAGLPWAAVAIGMLELAVVCTYAAEHGYGSSTCYHNDVVSWPGAIRKREDCNTIDTTTT